MPAIAGRRHVALAIAAALVAGVAIFLVMRGSNVERAVAGIRPASLPVAAETRESGQVSRPPRTGPVVTPPSMPHDINPRVADPGESIATPQWKNWHDAPPIDRARALDLLADKVVREQDEKADAQSVLARMKFERNPVNTALTDEANANMRQFLSGLDADARQHTTLGSVECRGDACQVLVAVNGFVTVATANNISVPQGPIDLQQTVDAMTGQSWWNQSGYAIGGFSAEFRDGYALYEINFTRPAK